jgi:predicted dehydrogenase
VVAVADLRVGVVGSGWVATDRYLPVLQRIDEVEVVGIADRNHDRARTVAADYGTPAFQDAVELIDLHPDALFVCTSPFSHASIATAAMRKGIDVFVEKPMALDNDESAEMVGTAADTGRKLSVSHNQLFSRSVSSVSSRIASGKLGVVRHVLALQSSSPNRRLPHWYPELRGGLFFDEAPHMVYLLDAFLEGFEVDHAWSEGTNGLTSLGADLLGGGGTRGQLTMIFDAPVSEWFLSIVCDEGVAVIDLFRDIQLVLPPDGGHRPHQILRTSLAGVVGHGLGTVNTGARYLARRQFWGHDVIIADFLDAVRQDRPPAVTGEDGARVVSKMIEILDAAGVYG